MNGWLIFKKSITQIYFNLGNAIRLTGLLWAVGYIISLLPLYFWSPEAPPELGNSLIFAATMVVNLICMLWIAVLWHRFMLLEENVDSIVPSWSGALVWSYFKAAIVVGMIIVLASAVPFLIFSYFSPLFFGISIWLGYGMLSILGLLIYYFSLRISLVLPAAAIEKPISIGDSWRVTQPASGAILVASLILVLFSILLQTPFGASGAGSVINLISSFFTQWISVMLGVSILTTLYGHLVENRPLG